jgi:hypothetical protein
MAIVMLQSALKGMALERNATDNDNVKLTIKFTKPIRPIPKTDIKITSKLS